MHVTTTRQGVIERYFEDVLGGLKMDVADELLSADVVARAPGAPPVEGIQAFKGFLTGIGSSFPERRVEIGAIAVGGEASFGVFTLNQVHLGEYLGIAPTGNKVQVTGVNEFRFDGDKISEITVFYNPLDLLNQIGASPEATAAYTPD